MGRLRDKNKFNLTFEEFCKLLDWLSQIEAFERIHLFKVHDVNNNEVMGTNEIGVGLALELFESLQNGGSDEVV